MARLTGVIDSVGGSRYGLATFSLSCDGFAWTYGGIASGDR
ncbi:hypothetical protein O7631_27420 [Micromonospora sp. WMMD967]|jgi:D-alanyl-D-alanine carboxypeptidase|nr:hypothetical protein [Micromonospora sp. WMMD967]MDG4840274.1 hypothetical protein [Micromonospora sp. WMMD967]